MNYFHIFLSLFCLHFILIYNYYLLFYSFLFFLLFFTFSDYFFFFIQIVSDSKKHKDLRIAAIHSLRYEFLFNIFFSLFSLISSFFFIRRIFIHLIEANKVGVTADSSAEVSQWLVSQYLDVKKIFASLLQSSITVNTTTSWASHLILRTFLEFIKLDHLVFKNFGDVELIGRGNPLGVATLNQVYDTIINTKEEVDIEIIILLKDEYLIYTDILYHTFLLLREYVVELKEQIKENSLIKNNNKILDQLERKKITLLDIIRILSLPIDLSDDSSFLLPVYPEKKNKKPRLNEDNSDEDNDDSEDEEDLIEKAIEIHDKKDVKLNYKEQKSKESENAAMELLLGKDYIEKLKNKNKVDTLTSKKRKRTGLNNLSEREKLLNSDVYKENFSKLWQSFLSLNLNLVQHKIILKHLSDYNIISQVSQPILFADYFTQVYNYGGVLAVLALDSLFYLILQHNFDYPKFFVSLYKLCTIEILNSKYSSKFLKLLSASLKSTNLPAYLVASFIKRFAQLCLVSSTPNILFLLTQIRYLLRQHKVCQVLLQRSSLKEISYDINKDKEDEDKVYKDNIVIIPEFNSDIFNVNEDEDLEKTNALSSSLWELIILENHLSSDVSKMATELRDPESTSILSPIVVTDPYLNSSFSSLISDAIDLDNNENKKKDKNKRSKNYSFSYKKPEKLFQPNLISNKLFGF